MLIYDADITGSFKIDGSTISSIGSLDNISGSVVANSSSIASLESVSGSYANSASFASDISANSASIASLESVSGSYANSASFASDISTNSASAASLSAATSSYLFNTTDTLTGDLTVTGEVVAQTLHVQQVTSSIVYSSGSNVFGESTSDTQKFTGSLQVSGSTNYLLGDVGIGDTNPSFILDTNITSTRARFKANTGDANIELSSIAGRDWLISSLTDGSLRFYDEDAASERMRIDSSGRVGIGVTPFSWDTSFDNIQIGNKISLWNASNNGGLSYNQYYNGTNNVYQTTDTANRFQMDADGFHFYQAASGTAGTSATFTESMRIDSNGAVGIGRNTASYRLSLLTNSTVQNGIYVSGGTGNSNHALYIENQSGSAEHFAVRGDGQIRLNASGAGNVLVNTTVDNTYDKLQVIGNAWIGGNSTRGIRIADGGTYGSIVGINQAISAYAALELRASGTNGQLFLDTNGNVGIGTISPQRALDVVATADSTPAIRITRNGDSTQWMEIQAGGANTSFISRTAAVHSQFQFISDVGGSQTTRMIIDQSGNVGILNTSPSDFDTWQRQLVVGNGSADAGITLYHGSGGGNQGAIAFADGNTGSDRYRGSISYNGADLMKFYTAASERMAIRSDGSIYMQQDTYSGITTGLQILNPVNAAGTGHGTSILLHSTAGDPNRGVKIASYSTANYAVDNAMVFYTSLSSTLYERMRIDSGGDVYIKGQANPTLYFQTNSTTTTNMFFVEAASYVGTAPYNANRLVANNSSHIAFEAGGSERMRITSGGEVDITGTVKSGGNQRFGAGPAHGNSSNPGITTKANGTAGVYWNSDGSGGWGGGNFTTNNSDRNMKTNIVPMDINALNIINSLETKYFNWTEKANKGDTSIRKAGIIAQDLKELMPEAVYGTEWNDEDENTNGLALDENATTALLIKAVQELKADNDSLRARIEALENA